MTDLAGRVLSAGRVDLLRINYEILIDAIDSGDLERAKNALALLADSLDARYESARTVFPIYVYMNKLLIEATPQSLYDCKDLAGIMLEGWRGVRDGEAAQPGVIHGLTYGRDGELNELAVSAAREYNA
jgi:hypothetical protein